jgi:hypothetical protein
MFSIPTNFNRDKVLVCPEILRKEIWLEHKTIFWLLLAMNCVALWKIPTQPVTLLWI